MKKLNAKGDTLIEVLVCLAILGFVMTLAYSIVSRAQQTIRNSQERVEALKIAEGQLEQLKSLFKGNPNPDALFPNGNPDLICVDQGSSGPVIVGFSGQMSSSYASDNDINSDAENTYPNECKNLPDPNGLYRVSITRPAGNNTDGLYIVRVRWNRLGSGVVDQVKLEYRLYKD